MTAPKRLNRDEVLALRGLRLPAVALKGLQRAGVYCQPAISIEFQQATQGYAIRGVESGGAVARIGAYCGFVDGAGSPLAAVHSITSLTPNGLHAAVVSCALFRVQMLRVERTYELLITGHALVIPYGRSRPKLDSSVLFHGRHGTLDLELWGRDKALLGAVVPVFYTKRGEQAATPTYFFDEILRVTAGACCVGCRHSHLAGFRAQVTYRRETDVE
jgi:hypothetical protein